ncbi:MAG: right-handed parallel beta-helix repeat-containing protein, partial [Actinomycetota bacterium]
MTSHRAESPAGQQARLPLILCLGLLVGCQGGLLLADRSTGGSEGHQEAGPRPCGPDSGTCSGLCIDGSCIGVCIPGARRCTGPIPQTCSASGQWEDGAACPHGCQEGNCDAAREAGPGDGGRDSPPITGVTYYVSPTGLDSNPGTQSQPWKTIKKAADTMVAGDAVQILAGTYHEQVVPLNSGSPGKPITYLAAPGTAVIDGTGLTLSSGGYGEGMIQLTGKSHIVIRGLTIKNSAVHGISVTSATNVELAENTILNTHTAAIKVNQSQNIRIRDNTIKHVLYSSGIGVWTSEHVLVDHNFIDTPHWYHECQGAHEEGLSIASVNHFEVAYNTLDYSETPPAGYCSNSQRLGIDVKESSQDGLVHHNEVRNMDAAGIYVDGWHAGANGTPTLNHINIYQNKVSSGGGIVVGCEQADGVVEHINIYNNLVMNVRFSGIQVRGAWGDGLRKNITIYNNTVYGANPAGGHGGAGIYVTTS